jgi:hypothetical protein
MGPNPRLYRELNQPFASPDELDAAIKAFLADVMEARKRHRILNIVMMLQCPVMTDAEIEMMMGTDACYGDAGQWEAMAARMLGAIQADRQRTIAEMITGAVKRRGER